jgi:hypothetical protein
MGRHKNGLNTCVHRIGKRIVINMSGFDEWIESKK